MQYPKKSEKKLTAELFKNPTVEYRAAPFWAWNNDLDEDNLRAQIDNFEKMGFGGYFMHIRPGYTHAYFDDMYIKSIRTCIEHSKKKGMKAYLYDEDKWPSGYAGGEVTKEPKYRQRYIKLAKTLSERDEYLCSFKIVFNGGYIESYEKTLEKSGENVYLCAVGSFELSGWFGGYTYADTLSVEAMNRFIECTHKRLFDLFGDDIPEISPLIFTDEPQFEKACKPFSSSSGECGLLPWSLDFEKDYYSEYGYSVLDKLPEIFFNKQGGLSFAGYDYYKYLLKRFSGAFPENIGAWCDAHGIGLTGHFMCEYPLENQTRANAEAMYCYRGFAMPGVDILIDLHEFVTLKQAQSVVNQYGKDGVTCECYGVTNWRFAFRDFMHQGNWLAALGVRMRVPHLSWYSMEADAKRDFPPSINHQAPWHGEYREIEDHFARLNTALVRAKSRAKIAVVHPIESNWLCMGDTATSKPIYEEINGSLDLIVNSLLENTTDFDFVSEALLAEQEVVSGKTLRVGEMEYEAVIVPPVLTLRSSTLDIIEKLKAGGCRLAIAGAAPERENGKPSARPATVFEGIRELRLTKREITAFVEPVREVGITSVNNEQTSDKICFYGDDGDCRWLFITPLKKPKNPEDVTPSSCLIKIKGEFKPTLFDTATGETKPIFARYENGKTVIPHVFYNYDSLLLCLSAGVSDTKPESKAEPTGKPLRFNEAYPVTLAEPNVLVLDIARYSFNGEPFSEKEEILRIGSEMYKRRYEGEDIKTVTLLFEVESEINASVSLALEALEAAKISLNGAEIPIKQIGFYIDVAEKKVFLGRLKPGKNEIRVTYDTAHLRSLEQMYLLGGFGVRISGSNTRLVHLESALAFGDIGMQGLPFYGGNITYHLETPACGAFTLRVSHIFGGLCAVDVDGARVGRIYKPPYTIRVSELENRPHKLDITYFGNRVNTLMPLHNAELTLHWIGGGRGWYRTEEQFAYEYLLDRAGILISPCLWCEE